MAGVSLSSQPFAYQAIAVFDIDGVVRDVSGSYRRALADTVEHYTQGAYRPSQAEIDILKTEGIWNNDWEASQEMVYRYYEDQGNPRASHVKSEQSITLNYEEMVAFFQARYRGPDPTHWTGYICQEPLLMQATYLNQLTQAEIGWGFFSGATRGSASYVLEHRLGLQAPPLVAMEDAPGKPDPTGFLQVIQQLEQTQAASPARLTPALYIGDTVADMYTVSKARLLQPERQWVGVGVLPPHVQSETAEQSAYEATLKQSGAQVVLKNVQELTPELVRSLIHPA